MSYEVPEGLAYLETHEWLRVEDGTGRVGISDFAQDELGDVVFVELPDVGDDFERGAEFGVVESIKAISDIYAPATGEVTAVNQRLEDEPELVNEDPYGDGWLVEVDLVDAVADREALLDAAAYREQIE